MCALRPKIKAPPIKDHFVALIAHSKFTRNSHKSVPVNPKSVKQARAKPAKFHHGFSIIYFSLSDILMPSSAATNVRRDSL
jgi:hypothetical protein